MNIRNQISQITEKNHEDVTFEEFQLLLKYHDWTYMYSDDHRYWVSGERSWKQIRNIANRHEDDPKWDNAIGEASPFKAEKIS
jgi:hypothetical protein